MNLIRLGAELGVIIGTAYVVYTSIVVFVGGVVNALLKGGKKEKGNEKTK